MAYPANKPPEKARNSSFSLRSAFRFFGKGLRSCFCCGMPAVDDDAHIGPVETTRSGSPAPSLVSAASRAASTASLESDDGVESEDSGEEQESKDSAESEDNQDKDETDLENTEDETSGDEDEGKTIDKPEQMPPVSKYITESASLPSLPSPRAPVSASVPILPSLRSPSPNSAWLKDIKSDPAFDDFDEADNEIEQILKPEANDVSSGDGDCTFKNLLGRAETPAGYKFNNPDRLSKRRQAVFKMDKFMSGIDEPSGEELTSAFLFPPALSNKPVKAKFPVKRYVFPERRSYKLRLMLPTLPNVPENGLVDMSQPPPVKFDHEAAWDFLLGDLGNESSTELDEYEASLRDSPKGYEEIRQYNYKILNTVFADDDIEFDPHTETADRESSSPFIDDAEDERLGIVEVDRDEFDFYC